MFNRSRKTCVAGRHYRAALSVGAMLLSFAVYADTIQDAHKLFKQGQQSQAMEKVSSFLATKPKDAQARFLKGLILTEQGKSAEAIKIFSALTEDYPELPEPYNNLAVLYASQGQYDKAKLALEMAIRTHPSYATAHENLGDIYAKMASQAYDRALKLDRTNTVTQTKLAMIQDLFAGSTHGKSAVPRIPGKTEVPAPGKTEGTVPVKVEAPKVEAPKVEAPKVEAPAKVEVAKKAEVAVPVRDAKAKPEIAKAEPPANGKNGKSASNTEVMKAVNAWAAAWSAKDVKKYLTFYAADFAVPDGLSRAAWEAMRRERIAKPKTIKVGISNAVVNFSDNDHATVKFHQSYHASHLNITGNKTLIMVRAGSLWLIKEESAK
jgi:tetratricopeptide (TPR) repeat protein